jgi:hypothetical protein
VFRSARAAGSLVVRDGRSATEDGLELGPRRLDPVVDRVAGDGFGIELVTPAWARARCLGMQASASPALTAAGTRRRSNRAGGRGRSGLVGARSAERLAGPCFRADRSMRDAGSRLHLREVVAHHGDGWTGAKKLGDGEVRPEPPSTSSARRSASRCREGDGVRVPLTGTVRRSAPAQNDALGMAARSVMIAFARAVGTGSRSAPAARRRRGRGLLGERDVGVDHLEHLLDVDVLRGAPFQPS